MQPRVPLFKASGTCVASYCTAKLNCHANKVDKCTVHVKISGRSKLSTYNRFTNYIILDPCMHVVRHTFGQLRGIEREKFTKVCSKGHRPLAVHNSALSELSNTQFAVGVR